MSQVRGMFPQLMAPGMKTIYDDWSMTEQKEKEYPMVFNVKTTDSEYEQEMEMAGVGPLEEKPENSPTGYKDMVEGGTKRVIPLTYSLGIRTSKELMDDDKYGLMRQGPKALARSVRFTEEVVAWAQLNLGFTTAVTTFDGQPLFSNTHYLIGGPSATAIGPGLANVITTPGTYPNRPATDIDLSIAALQLATNHANRMVDNMGFPIKHRFKYLMIAPENIFIARELLGTPGAPYTSDNTINSILPEDYKFLSCSYFNSPSAFFLATDKKDHALTFWTRESPKTTFDDDFDTDALKQKVRMRIASSCFRWQGLWGSNGP